MSTEVKKEEKKFPFKLLLVSIITVLIIDFFDIWGTYCPPLASLTGWLGSIDYSGAGWGWMTLIPRVLRVLPAIFIIALINGILRYISGRIGKRIYLNAKEFAVVFASVIMATAWGWFFIWPSMGLFFALAHGGYDALAYLRPAIWWMPSTEIYEMALKGGVATPWGAIAGPVAMWLILYIALFIMFIGLTNIMRKQWIEVERLPFPEATAYTTLINLSTGTGITKTHLKVFVIGFILAVLWRLPHILTLWYRWVSWGMLHGYVRTDFKAVLGLDQALPGSFPNISIAPHWICLFILAPVDVLLSTWITWFAVYFIMPPILYYAGIMPASPDVLHNAMGWIVWSMPLSLRNVYFGMILGMAIIPLVLSWKYIRSTLEAARKRAPREPSEPASYFTSYLLFAGGFIVLFLLFISMGANPWSAFILPIIIILWFLGFTRVYANVGVLPMHGEYDALVIPWTCANLFYVKDVASIDPNAFTVQFMSYSTIEVWGCEGNTAHTMCNAMMAYKVGDDTKADPKHIFIIGSIATIVSVVVVFLYMLNLIFTVGINNIPSYCKWFVMNWGIDDPRIVNPESWMIYRIPVHEQALRWIIGIIIVAIVTVLQLRVPLLSWLNPAGVVFGVCWELDANCGGAWPILIAWIIKYIVIRFYGSEAYSKYVVPVAIGYLSGFTFVSVVRRTYLCLRWMGVLP